MKQRTPVCSPRPDQSGYALLMAIFLVALVIILTAVAMPNVLTQGRREKEEEMIWRGKQYARAIGLYYHKYGRFPQKIQDLTDPAMGVRFLRQAYPDPMNSADGTWRLIYIAPNGQLIGSVRKQSLVQMPAIPPVMPGAQPVGATSAPTTPGGLFSTPSTEPSSFGTGMEGQVFGGNIIGVGSKVNRPSIKVYEGGKTYREWEFIWNPMQGTAAAGAVGVPAANPPAQGQQPFSPQMPPLSNPLPKPPD